jgi:post-segregation antitoxin (ccd killing protein)
MCPFGAHQARKTPVVPGLTDRRAEMLLTWGYLGCIPLPYPHKEEAVPKVNIYLPDDLADEARAAKLSLSPICQRSIREELDKVHAKQAATSDLKAVAARLNDTIAEEEREQQREGHDDGVKWAREYATATELRHIAEDLERDGQFDSTHSVTRFLGDKDHQNLISRRHEEGDAYWYGFSAGADEVLDAVGPLLGD